MQRLEPLGLQTLGMRSLGVLLVRLGGAGAGFLFQVALARELGAHEAGAFALALTVALLAAVIGRLGLDSAVLKFAAAAYAERDGAALGRIEPDVRRIVLATSVVLCGAIVLFAPWLAASAFDEPDLVGPLRLMAASVPLFSLGNLYGEMLRAAERPIAAAMLQGVALPASNLALLLLLGAVIDDATAVAGAHLTSCALLFVLGRRLWGGRLAQAVGGTAGGMAGGTAGAAASDPSPSVDGPRRLLHTALPMYGATLASLLLIWVDVLLLGIWSTSEAVGIYNAATRTAQVATFVLMAIGSIVAPRFASTELRADPSAMARLARRACLLATAATLPPVLVCVLAGEWVMALFGPSFVAGAGPLAVIALGHLATAVTGPASHLLNMTGHQVAESVITTASVLVVIALCALWIPRWGAIGAAAANATALVLCSLLRAAVVRRRLGVLLVPGL